MADTIRRVVLELLARNRAKGEMAGFRRDLDITGRTMKRMAVGALSLAGIGGFGYLAKSMIDAASSAEETQAKFDTVFRDLSSQANTWAESFGHSVGRAEQDVKSWMAGLQDTFVPLGIARAEAMGLSKSLVTLAVDVASFNNKVDADVIRDFTSALVGNHETVRKYGIIISESALKQEAMRRGIKKTYSELTDLEKVQLRYNLILAGTEDAQGDAIRTSDSYANQVKRLKANLDDLKVSMGQDLLPTFTDFVKLLNDSEKELAALATAIMAPVKSLLIMIDIVKTLKEVQEKEPIKPLSQEDYNMWIAGGPAAMSQAGRDDQGKKRVEEYLKNLRERDAAEQKRIKSGLVLPEVIHFDDPEFWKGYDDLNTMTPAQEKAGRTINEMMMKARGLGDELARENEILVFTALASERYAADTEGAAAAVERFKAALTELDDAKAREKSAQDEKDMLSARADAYRDIYGQMGKMTKSAYDAQRQILANMYEDYKKLKIPEEDLNVWMKEKQRTLSIEYMKTSGGMAEGFAAAGMTIRHEIDSWGDKAYRFSMSFRESIASGLENSMRDFDNWKDHLLNVFEEVYWSAVRIAFIEPMAKGLAAGMTLGMSAGINALLGGGGAAATPSAFSSPHGGSAFPSAQHGGEVLRSGLAVIHKGETYSGVGNGGGVTSFDVHIHNEGQEKLEISRVESYIVSDQRIIDITTRAMQTDVKYRRSVAQAAR